jgi:hypothetical protein
MGVDVPTDTLVTAAVSGRVVPRSIVLTFHHYQDR